jgi:hypothetical protein
VDPSEFSIVATASVDAELPESLVAGPRLRSIGDVRRLRLPAVVLVGEADPLLPAIMNLRWAAALMVVDRPAPLLDFGVVDDYIFAPVDPNEVLARGRRAFIRSRHALGTPLRLDRKGARLGDRHVALTPGQHRLMAHFLNAEGGLATAVEIRAVLRIESDDKHTIEARIARLRRRLAALQGVGIETVRQRGYRLVVDGSAEHYAERLIARF